MFCDEFALGFCVVFFSFWMFLLVGLFVVGLGLGQEVGWFLILFILVGWGFFKYLVLLQVFVFSLHSTLYISEHYSRSNKTSLNFTGSYTKSPKTTTVPKIQRVYGQR